MRSLLEELFQAALRAADPEILIRTGLPRRPGGRVAVVGAGKASAAMAREVERRWGPGISGIVVVPYGYAARCAGVEVLEAGHPHPDAAGREAARRVLALARELAAGDTMLALISGGGSALLAAPAPGIALSEKRAVGDALLRSGASIAEFNTVRKHLSAIKGGRLAAAAFPAHTVALAISDVPGDDPATIASGPTVADPSTREDARGVLARYGIEPPPAVAAHLEAESSETPKPGESSLAASEFRLLGGPRASLEAAASLCRRRGYAAEILGDAIQGEARAVAAHMADRVRETRREGGRRALLSGGEVTVTVRGAGRGGPNAEFSLALAIELGGLPGAHAIACDTDGLDGVGGHAGAVIGPKTLRRAASLGLDPRAALAANDAHGFFAALGDLVVTGPTRTNVSDFRAIIVEGAKDGARE